MTGNGNIGDDPQFIDAFGPDNITGTADDDLHLSAGSLCIDTGDNDAVALDTADLDGDGDTGGSLTCCRRPRRPLLDERRAGGFAVPAGPGVACDRSRGG